MDHFSEIDIWNVGVPPPSLSWRHYDNDRITLQDVEVLGT